MAGRRPQPFARPLLCFNPRTTQAPKLLRGLKQSKGDVAPLAAVNAAGEAGLPSVRDTGQSGTPRAQDLARGTHGAGQASGQGSQVGSGSRAASHASGTPPGVPTPVYAATTAPVMAAVVSTSPPARTQTRMASG